ncbi:MAG: hypothetical protein ABR598_08460 [Candidatus Dormibacteria bacterium]
MTPFLLRHQGQSIAAAIAVPLVAVLCYWVMVFQPMAPVWGRSRGEAIRVARHDSDLGPYPVTSARLVRCSEIMRGNPCRPGQQWVWDVSWDGGLMESPVDAAPYQLHAYVDPNPGGPTIYQPPMFSGS